MTTDERTVIDIIIDDHNEVKDLFNQIESTTDTDAVQNLTSAAIAELVRYSVAEEQYLYPAMREHLDDGDSLVDHEIDEHAEAEQTMKDIERLDADDPQYRTKISTLMQEIRHHIQEEEDDALARLKDVCPHEQLVELGRQVERAKKIAPTRPHPMAPDKPPMNKILAPGAGLVDRVRDALTGRPE